MLSLLEIPRQYHHKNQDNGQAHESSRSLQPAFRFSLWSSYPAELERNTTSQQPPGLLRSGCCCDIQGLHIQVRSGPGPSVKTENCSLIHTKGACWTFFNIVAMSGLLGESRSLAATLHRSLIWNPLSYAVAWSPAKGPVGFASQASSTHLGSLGADVRRKNRRRAPTVMYVRVSPHQENWSCEPRNGPQNPDQLPCPKSDNGNIGGNIPATPSAAQQTQLRSRVALGARVLNAAWGKPGGHTNLQDPSCHNVSTSQLQNWTKSLEQPSRWVGFIQDSRNRCLQPEQLPHGEDEEENQDRHFCQSS